MNREFLELLIQHKSLQDIPVLHIIKVLVAVLEIKEEQNEQK